MSETTGESSGLLGLIEAQQDKGHYQNLLWEGSFSDYLSLVKKNGDWKIAAKVYYVKKIVE